MVSRSPLLPRDLAILWREHLVPYVWGSRRAVGRLWGCGGRRWGPGAARALMQFESDRDRRLVRCGPGSSHGSAVVICTKHAVSLSPDHRVRPPHYCAYLHTLGLMCRAGRAGSPRLIPGARASERAPAWSGALGPLRGCSGRPAKPGLEGSAPCGVWGG